MTKEIECRAAGIDCPFMIRDEDDNELASLAQQHLKNTHHKSMSREELLQSAKEV
jgi:predicted small metal-binding protein